MKHTLLSIAFIAAAATASAQCTPDPLYQDSIFGVWPDTLEDFAPGLVNVPYSDQMDLKIPSDAGDIDPNLAGTQIDSVALDSISGLPPGLAIVCNSHTSAPCTYLSAVLGCGLIEGTPTVAGSYPLTINVTGYSILFGFPISFPYQFTGYQIDIGIAGVSDLPVAISGAQNVPNPFGQRTSIEWNLSRPASTTVKVFNLLGEQLWSETSEGRIGANKLIFDGSALEDGIYLYEVQAGETRFTGRMVLHR
ncbi:MAG: T9SS type A sorting domain-containing protein [Flavobacteriales bacterium]